MPYFIDLDSRTVIVKSPGKNPMPREAVVDHETAVACGLKSGQLLTAEQVRALRDGSVSAYRAATANSGLVDPAVDLSTSPTSGTAATANSGLVDPGGHATTNHARTGAGAEAVFWTTIIAMLAWLVAGVGSIVQKHAADARIRESFDISAIQIQQLNGSVTAHVLVALVVAMGLTVPLMIALLSRIVTVLETSTLRRVG